MHKKQRRFANVWIKRNDDERGKGKCARGDGFYHLLSNNIQHMVSVCPPFNPLHYYLRPLTCETVSVFLTSFSLPVRLQRENI